jgi:acyl carrier protein phosphodiesterase
MKGTHQELPFASFSIAFSSSILSFPGMNYLAHLFLSPPTPDYLVGSLLGDFVKKAEINQYCDQIKSGIRLHQKVDIYTDAHPIVHLSKRLVHPDRRRFSGILVDVFFDHFLATNWEQFSEVSLRDFTNHVYNELGKYRNVLPEAISTKFEYLIRQDLLCSYRELAGIRFALLRISDRLSRINNLGDGIQDLEQNYQQMQQNFLSFFPELIDFVQSQADSELPTITEST